MARAPLPVLHPRSVDEAVAEAVARLALADKVRLLTGATTWTLHPAPTVGLRSLVFSDGPVGVRGIGTPGHDPSLLFPAPSAMAATWDPAAAAEVGALFAAEARRIGVDIVLAPVINIQRTPVGGRHFECLSEDPLLTGELAGALVAAAQAAGVGVCVKHFVANDSETERTSYVAAVDERALREVYLAPFERVVKDAGAWAVMAAYNGVDDSVLAAPATEHGRLVTDLLKHEWGFDGVVVSDWLATTSTVPAANAGLDLVMPGPGGPWGDQLLAAVEAGEVPEGVIDDKIARILRLADRVGALDGAEPMTRTTSRPGTARRQLRDLAARATVALRNDNLLPIDPAKMSRVALIGANAVEPFVQGGGSAFVKPGHVVTPAEGLRELLPADAVVDLLPGVATRQHAQPLAAAMAFADAEMTRPGVTVDLLDAAGHVVHHSVTDEWAGWLPLDGVHPSARAARLRTWVRLDATGRHELSVGTVGTYVVHCDGHEIDSGSHHATSDVILDSSVNDPDGLPVTVDVETSRSVAIDATVQVIDAGAYGRFVRAELRHRPPQRSDDAEIAAAVDAARGADLAVLVVGTNPESESEGWDRTTLALPGRQDELVRAVAAVNDRTVVVVNAGAPLLLPWLDEPGVGAVLWWWLPGQEAGGALADVLFGRTEPSGRLPWTLPARAEDVPVPHAIPVEGVLTYAEGIHVGHRTWDRRKLEPARPFGFGLGWTDWSYDEGHVVDSTTDGVVLDISVTNTGPRPGREVVQVYLQPEIDDPDRPVRWLAAHTVVEASSKESVTARVTVPRRSFEVWDSDHRGWRVPPGGLRATVGRSSRDLRLSIPVELPQHP